MTGPVHTGKTTRLMQWSMAQVNIDGIFQPLVDGKRFIYHISSKTLKNLETNQNNNVTEIGKYKFSNETFEWAQNKLLEASQKNLDWLIIDEIGPLELNNRGLEPVVKEILFNSENSNTKILCVVRDSILEKFIEHYGLNGRYELFNPGNNLNS